MDNVLPHFYSFTLPLSLYLCLFSRIFTTSANVTGWSHNARLYRGARRNFLVDPNRVGTSAGVVFNLPRGNSNIFRRA